MGARFVLAPLLIVGLLVGVPFVWSILWVFGDAQRRGLPGLLVAPLVALVFWPLSLFVWLVFRPAEKD